jgi:HEAT repeat protein
VPYRLATSLLLILLMAAPILAQNIETKFTTEKSSYLAGEPVFVALTVSNKGNEPIWLDFKSPDLPKLLCDDFAVEVPGAELADERWGCGIAGSCGRGLKEVPPGKSVSVQQLLNRQFRLQQAHAYTVHAHTAIAVHNQDLFDSPQVEQFDVSDTLTFEVQPGSENQLKGAFQPYVKELESPNLATRAEAAGAILELAPPFLEDILIELTKTTYAYATIAALRKADTLKTRNALAKIATGNEDSMLRMEAIRNLGRTGDTTYLPTLLFLMKSTDKQIQHAAAEAAGNLGGPASLQELTALVSSPDAEARVAGANALGYTRARQAVRLLIELLLDSDPSVRETAVSGLFLLTHRAAFDGDQWADVTTVQAAVAVHQRWLRWWNFRASTIEIHGMADCASPQSLD